MRRLGLLLIAAITAAATGWHDAPQPGPASGRPHPSAGTPPNIVVILADDQRWDSLWAMPNVRAELVDHGVLFKNMFVTNPNCCPSRTAILTGQYSHSTGVYSDNPPHGGFDVFRDGSTISTWLHGAGYRTAMIGKYLNGYADADASYVPPGWDRWVAFTYPHRGLGDYYNYHLSIDGKLAKYGSDPSDYSTDVLAALAEDFIRSTSPGQPLLLYYAPKAPHLPATPAPQYQHAFADLSPYRPPSYNEADVSDKPAFVQAWPRLTRSDKAAIDEIRKDQYRTLLSVDDAVAGIVQALRDTGRLSDTMIVYASDNGFLWGEHRWASKYVPYEESIRVPLVIRYDPLTAFPTADSHMVLNIDLAPTFADLAGVPASGADGSSLVPLLSATNPRWRTIALFEHSPGGSDTIPSYCAVRNLRYSYARYGTTERELYDLKKDPYELQNVVTDPSYSSLVQRLQAKLHKLCQPPPPVDGAGILSTRSM
jgi:N-acetylglucosamine-6-sulfatase